MGKTIKTQQQLEAEGWKIASVTGGTHLERILEMYRELGIEFYLQKVKAEECAGCSQCFTENKEASYRVYTRQH